MKYKHLQKGEANTFLIVSILAATAIMGCVIYYAATNTLTGNYKDRKTGITNVIASPEPTPVYNLKKNFVTKKVCAGDELKLEFNIPESWKCEADNGFLNITSDYFVISISNLGRGVYCDIQNMETGKMCEVTSFLKTNNYNLSMYSFKKEDKEIFGSILESNTTPKSWISIKYKNMETNKLSVNKNAELIDVLNSIKVK